MKSIYISLFSCYIPIPVLTPSPLPIPFPYPLFYPLIHSLERVRHIALGKVQGHPYCI